MDSGYYFRGGGVPRGKLLFEAFQKKYGGREVTVALKSFLRMSGYKKRSAPPEGHMNAWVQKAKVPKMLLETSHETSAGKPKGTSGKRISKAPLLSKGGDSLIAVKGDQTGVVPEARKLLSPNSRPITARHNGPTPSPMETESLLF